MSTSGDAAEQVVRLSVEGAEMAVKITGTAAKDISAVLTAVLKQSSEKNVKTHGRARLSSMLKSGKELKVFTMKLGDLKEFTKHAKDYGILYCVLKDKTRDDPEHQIDIIARADDASKIQRIFDHYGLGQKDGHVWKEAKVKVETAAEKEGPPRGAGKTDYTNEHSKNPAVAKTVKDPLSEPGSENGKDSADRGAETEIRPSVKEKLRRFKKADAKSSEQMFIKDKELKIKER